MKLGFLLRKNKEDFMKASVIGFPRVGTLRELKFATEKFFRGEKQSGIRRFSKAELDSIRMNSKYKAKNASHYFS